jgi:SAM-dependent methyltransferase
MDGTHANAVADPIESSERYRHGYRPWDAGRPSPELRRVVHQFEIEPCRTLELGCGAGIHSVWLAERGFKVTSVDVSPFAVKRADRHARAAGVNVHFVVADVFQLPDAPGALGLILAGNAREQPGVTAVTPSMDWLGTRPVEVRRDVRLQVG